MSSFTVYDETKRVLPTVVAKIYLKDPLVAAERPRVGIQEVKIDGETCLGPGPTSSRIAVVDYNGDLDTLFRGAELNSRGTAFNLGRKRPIDNFYFHQVHVWAVIHKTLELLEASDVLGRRIPWAFQGGRLLVLPHAGYWENAFYDRSSGALHFFYFENAVTGRPVYTCLSHDIVAHELGHAVLDGLKPYYNEVTSAETAGFHEYIGDAIALTAALNHSSIAVEVAGHGDGDLSAATIIQNIAAEFGQGLQPEYGSLADAYLRNAANDTTMSDLAGVSEEHDLSCVPTGVYYDLLRRVYEHIMQDKDRDQSKLRVAALMAAATVTRRMMLRALDYCPPVDLQFEDYAEAVVRADAIAYPIDSSGFRKLAIDAFQRRELGLQLHQRDKDLEIQNNQLRGLNIDELAASTTDAYHFFDRNRAVFRIPSDVNFDVINLYRTKKIGANDYRVPQEIVMEFVWREEMELRQRRFGPLRGSTFPMWCGGTAVFSREGNLLHYVVKLNENRRRETLARYIVYLIQEGYLTVDDGEQGIGSAMSGRSKVVAAVRDGKLSVTRCAAMRHHRQQRGGRSHG